MTDDLNRQDREFAQAAGKRLRAGADELDAATRSRLNQARQAALASMPAASAGRRPFGAPGWLAAATLGVVAFGVWQVVESPDTLPPAGPALPGVAAAPDLELLLGEEDLEMLEDLEFFAWMAAESAGTGQQG